MRWPTIIRNGWPLKPWQSGRVLYAILPVIVIRKGYEGDRGLWEHERTHARQWLRRPLTHWLRYRLSKPYRLECEAEAYAVQTKYGLPIEQAAYMLASHYGLDIGYNAAKAAIQKYR